MSRRSFHVIIPPARLVAALALLAATAWPGYTLADDVAAESPESVREHHRRMPDDDMWWTVRGEQMAWMHRHIQQLFPTVPVWRGGPVRELEHAPLAAIAEYPVETPTGAMPFAQFLSSEHSSALGIVILHRGKIVFESYPRMRQFEKPIYWSATKVFAGAIVRILEERGDLDSQKSVADYITELDGTPYGDVTIRNVLDHATGLDCGDEYEDRSSCYYQYSMAIGDGFREDGAPDNPYDFLIDLEVDRLYEQGTHFSYSGTNTFVLMWLIEELTGRTYNDVFSGMFWRPIGAEADAAFIAYRYGIPLAHGGFISTLRDLARFGLLYTPSFGVVSDRRIVSDAHIDFLQTRGRPGLLASTGIPVAGSPDAPDLAVRYNIYQWGAVFTNGAMLQGGWGGQGLIVNPLHDTVAVFAAYTKEDSSEIDLEPIVLEMLDELFGDAVAR